MKKVAFVSVHRRLLHVGNAGQFVLQKMLISKFFIRILFAVPLFEFRQSHCVIGMHRTVLTAPMFARPERLLLLINCLGPIFLILKLGLLCDPLKIC